MITHFLRYLLHFVIIPVWIVITPFILLGRIFLDMAIHDIDYICWLVGEKPSSVCAFGSISSDNAELYKSFQDVDCVTAILNFPNGVMAQMEDTRETNIGYEQRVEVNRLSLYSMSRTLVKYRMLPFNHHDSRKLL